MEWYHQWESEYRAHKEEHELNTGELDECLNCELCYPIENEPIVFKKFWDALFKFEDAITIYNNVTIKGVLDLLSMNNSEREDTIHKGKCRDIMDRITESIRYRIQPKMKEKGLRTIILVIVRDCIEGDLENEVFDRLIRNPELMEHRYILEDWDVERRFEKFWQWYRVALGEIKAVKIKEGAIERFKELLYEEEKIAESEEEVKDLIVRIGYENIEIDNVHEHHKNMIQKIIRVFIDTRGFTKEPEDLESESSPVSYELENDSEEEELEIIIGDKSWKFSELKRRTNSIDEDQLRYIWKIGIKLMIEMDILVTKIFIDKVQEIDEIDEEEKELKIKEWLEEETIICKRCGNRRFEMDKTDNECGECIKEMQKNEQDELAELKDELEKLGYEIDISEIQRMKSFGVNNRIIITEEFIMEYIGIIELEDKELRKEIHKWLNENTTWCERCEIRWMNNMFRLGENICKDCEEEDIDEIDNRVKKLQKIFEDIGIIVIEEELLRLTSMGYTDGEILDKEFIEIFQENKNKSERELKKKLDKLLKEQVGTIDSEESGEKGDDKESEENTDSSEKIGEILSPEEYEEWDENIEDINEDESENEIENVINTGGLGLSQNSDSNSSLNFKNSDTESEISDYNLQELFQENILVNMATVNEIRGLFRTFVQNQYGNDLGNDLGTANPHLVNNALGNINATRGLVVEFPLFGGSESEDAEEWVQRFRDAYTTNALADDNVNRFRIVKECLVGTARDWLRTEGINIDNWGGENNDTSLDRRIVAKYASDEIKERWQDELENIKQGDKESVTGYVTRFRSIVKKAGGDVAVPAGSQKRIFMKGLSLEYIRGTYATKPAN
ncbi:unnamed protein product [Rhizophagus irregularis]|nr:unnamed protein product [Rhizophagus irregularis]